MKKLLSFLSLALGIITALPILAQTSSPEMFNYQAIVRDNSGSIVSNQNVSFRMSIEKGGTPEYVETHSGSTNDFGLVSLMIGQGTPVSGSMNTIDWANGPYSIKVEVDPAGGSSYAVLSTTQLVSVPYALHALSADNVDDADADPANEIQDLQISGNSLQITGNGSATVIDLSGYLDNTDAQMLSWANDTLYLTDGGSIYLGAYNQSADIAGLMSKISTDSAAFALALGTLAQKHIADSIVFAGEITNIYGQLATDLDKDSTNEIQSLSLNGTTLTLTDGGSVSLSSLNPWNLNSNGIDYSSGNVGIGTNNPSQLLHLVDTLSVSSGYPNLIRANATAMMSGSNNSMATFYAEAEGNNGWSAAVDGTSSGTSAGTNVGVGGYAYNGAINLGVFSYAQGSSATNIGYEADVQGGNVNIGVWSHVNAGSSIYDDNLGVHSTMNTNNGFGRGVLVETEGSNPASGILVEARSDSLNFGLESFARSYSGNSNTQYAIIGTATGGDHKGSFSTGAGNHFGVYGRAFGEGSGFSIGILGYGQNGGTGVTRGAEVEAGSMSSTFNQGLIAFATTSNSAGGYNAGIYSLAENNTTTNYGIVNIVPGTAPVNYGAANYAYGAATGVNYGAYNYAVAADTNYGMYSYAVSSGDQNYGVYSEASGSAGSLSGYFVGNVTVSGNLNVTGSISKGSGTFKIDHPSDPENKYLVHSFVESPDMMNVYNGNVTTDANGIALVQLPDYVQDNNKDFRYQLTPIGQFAQCIVLEEVNSNQFKIQNRQTQC
jgi:hypothetical protein